MTIQAHIGDEGVARVIMTDAQGNETGEYDVTGGITWTTSHPDHIQILDEDAKPEDVNIDFLQLLEDEEGYVEVSFDGAVGDDERRITLRSEGIMIVPGEATGGTVEITMRPV